MTMAARRCASMTTALSRDNPFFGRADANPEIFTLGHRINLGMAMNPVTREIWVSERPHTAGTR